MQTLNDHVVDGNRYAFDFGCCSAKHGWAQVDTGQDAWYFGTWAHPTRLQIVCYAEGDVSVQTADSPEEFAAEMRRIKEFHDSTGWKFLGIDAMCNDETEQAFKALGLGDLLH